MTIEEAVKEAAALLNDEANELACFNEFGDGKQLPHRVKVAIRKEIEHFRSVAKRLKEELRVGS